MIEHPIIFSNDMVRALLDNLKTMTRRTPGLERVNTTPSDWESIGRNAAGLWEFSNRHDDLIVRCKCPYGQVGDYLWVRETFVLESDLEYGYDPEELAQWAKDRPIKTEDGGYEWGEYHLIPHYRATEPEPNIVPMDLDTLDDKTRWSPSLFMPRWASRILLEITELRVERVQDISEKDCKAEGLLSHEGFSQWYTSADTLVFGHKTAFQILWDSLNAKRGYGWNRNNWVWPISFRRVE